MNMVKERNQTESATGELLTNKVVRAFMSPWFGLAILRRHAALLGNWSRTKIKRKHVCAMETRLCDNPCCAHCDRIFCCLFCVAEFYQLNPALLRLSNTKTLLWASEGRVEGLWPNPGLWNGTFSYETCSKKGCFFSFK